MNMLQKGERPVGAGRNAKQRTTDSLNFGGAVRAAQARTCAGCGKPFGPARKVSMIWTSALDGVPVYAATCRSCSRIAQQLGNLAALLPVRRRMQELERTVDQRAETRGAR